MEKQYFILSNGQKEGPFKIDQLKSMELKNDMEVWRSDFVKWEKIYEVEELKDFITPNPPKTNNEIKVEEFNKKYLNWLKLSIFIYIAFSFIITILSLIVTQNSWNTFLQKLKENNIDNQTYIKSESSSNMISLFEVSLFNRYPIYERGVDLENIYGIQQGDLFRTYKPFFSTNYITRKERNEG
jgi:hypothetical protein